MPNLSSLPNRSAEMDACLAACSACHATCLETFSHCLAMGGQYADRAHVTLLVACADICRASADNLLRRTPVHLDTCRACARICRQCADSCQAMGDDAGMRRCAEACMACAGSCESMVAGDPASAKAA
jgi:hypothetical protein